MSWSHSTHHVDFRDPKDYFDVSRFKVRTTSTQQGWDRKMLAQECKVDSCFGQHGNGWLSLFCPQEAGITACLAARVNIFDALAGDTAVSQGGTLAWWGELW
jgi:hypothetical protein